ncbi:NCA2-domain-containing protein [Teratosphaeria nubilosa]|uniref:NCA2-domain-containing protein n=1 Tax=Teratosphaeria nubilosa TaxID=161662 RepID=A0A6G1LAZ2_9PEZI|nr:NCA2-domain-containing protein [Teratosphaeria nubilosa]
MSFIIDHVRRIDAQLDRLQLSKPPVSNISAASNEKDLPIPSKRLIALQASVRGLTPSTTDSRALLPPGQIQLFLSTLSSQPEAPLAVEEENRASKEPYETELEWLLVSKATTQTYGHVLKRILDQTVAIADDIYYWDEILGSRRYSALYGVQISPFHFWSWTSSVWEDVKARGGNFSISDARRDAQGSIGKKWQEFYGLVRQVVRERSVAEIQKQVLSPVTRLRSEIRQKQTALRKVRIRNANALGVLLGEGLANESAHGEGLSTSHAEDAGKRWKASVSRNVALIEAVLAKVNDLATPVEKFDAAVAEITDEDPLYGGGIYEESDIEGGSAVRPEAVAERLSRVLSLGLPQYTDTTRSYVREHGKPSWIVRYWLPVTVGLLSSGTILRMILHRQAEILQGIQDLGTTILDFWNNWVVEPTRKVIKTIRHDEGSEVSIMSKRSLEGDRDSLERMVVDFAIDNPAHATGSNAKLTDAEIADVRMKVREGDLTPVLRAYEKDLASPFMGTVRGNLIRALLIQVQKTKVDVEVAIGGIDSLLKSQELVFGFIGLTPGLLVTYFVLQYFRSSLSEKRGSKAARKQGKMLRQLRNIDRILTNSTPTEYSELYYKDQGLLLCEVHGLRQATEKAMPAEIYKEFSEDADELCDVRIGAEKQRQTATRIRWAYARYLS